MKILVMIGKFLLGSCVLIAQTAKQNASDAALLHRAEKALTDVIVHDIFSPPVASRIYVYANISAYEILAQTNPAYKSLHDHLRSIPKVEVPAKKISYPLAAVYSFLQTGKKLVFSEPIFEDSIKTILKSFQGRGLSPAVYRASIEYGEQISNAIIAWASKDHYGETRKLKRYQFSKTEGKWIPTPPGYMAAIEPYWNRIRTLSIDSASQFQPAIAETFSKEKNSPFYQQAYEVFETGKKLSEEQRNIANFWDCNPFFLNTEGHLNFATKKISPGGHWISITGILCKQLHADIVKTAAAYTCMSIAMFDAFISCWDEKYRSNVIRPETYINSYIDESWRPILQTPPFPEYTSGHSVVSAACSVILIKIFGDKIAFTDNSEMEFGLPERKFSSISEASNEAAISRLYGGIHYRAAIMNGFQQGERIGKYVVEHVVNTILTPTQN